VTSRLAAAPPPGAIALLAALGAVCIALLIALWITCRGLGRDIRRDDMRRQQQAALDEQHATDPTRLTITWATRYDIPERWCRQHGYRAVHTFDGYVIQRATEPALVATPGTTLLWDGQHITIQEPS
jgi:hypothetical protein